VGEEEQAAAGPRLSAGCETDATAEAEAVNEAVAEAESGAGLGAGEVAAACVGGRRGIGPPGSSSSATAVPAAIAAAATYTRERGGLPSCIGSPLIVAIRLLSAWSG